MDYQNRYRETLNKRAEFGSSEAAENSENDLVAVQQDLADFKTCVDSVGTPLNNDENRAEVKRLRSVIKRKLSNAKIKVQEQRKGTSEERIQAQQVTKELNNYVQRFDGLLTRERDLTRQHQSQISDSVVDSPDAPIISYQEQATVSDVQDREKDAAELVELERDILDLHTIQKDLVGMVYEQGEITDNIEAHVDKSAVKVEHGNRRLESAVVLSSKNRKLRVAIALCIAIPIAVILIIIIIVLAVVLSKNSNN